MDFIERSVMEEKAARQADLDNRANQLNPVHPAYHLSRGVPHEQALQQARLIQATLTPPPLLQPSPKSG
jgi:hypothetical protein